MRRIGKSPTSFCSLCGSWNVDHKEDLGPFVWQENLSVVISGIVEAWICTTCGKKFLLQEGEPIDKVVFEQLLKRNFIDGSFSQNNQENPRGGKAL